IIIPVYNNAALTRTSVEAVLERTRVDFKFETIVANDASTDETVALLKTYGRRISIVSHASNCGFGSSCNDSAAVATGASLIFINIDTVPQQGWLDALVSYAHALPLAAVAGSKLLFSIGPVQHDGIVICEDRAPVHI